MEENRRYVDDELDVILKPEVKLESDMASAVTWNSDLMSSVSQNAPTSVATLATSHLELQLNFMAKELELERQRREKLEHEIKRMTRKLDVIETDGHSEVHKNERVRKNRESAVKRPNLDVDDIRVQNRGFVAFH